MKNKKASLLLPSFLLINLLFPLSSFSQTPPEEETFTITTYYPAPYGVYNEMRAKRIAIGDSYYKGSQYCWPPDTCTNQIDGISSPCWPTNSCNTDLIVEGNVGIGTVNPYSGLHIKKSAGTLILQTESVTETNDIQFYDADDATGDYKWDLSYRGNNVGDDLYLYRGPGTSPNAVMVWDYVTGNVGIGTASPAAKLDVTGNIKASGGIDPNYDSGWVASGSLNSPETFTHNLGQRPRLVQIWVAQNSDGSGWSFLSNGYIYDGGGPYTAYGIGIAANGINALKIRKAEMLGFAPTENGTNHEWKSTGYLRVLIWK